MKAHIITLFPDVISSYLGTSIMRIAQKKGVFEPALYNLADYSNRPTRRVDRRPYGWFPGMIISPEPLDACISGIFEMRGKKLDVYYVTPRGSLWDQQKAEQFSKINEEFIIICGHYEGIDERIVDMFDITEISIGEFVLTSGELSALVVLDSVVRLLPGVLSKDSLIEESYSGIFAGKKEYPQYTRPESYKWRAVPGELLSGDPKKIQQWKNSYL